ncbi:histidine kinase [Streptomyces sp. 549]|uniref:sensor histidine kinase n=1 Tax=Streptomyces sp. 549 TaxID=3049076 RepID=UPI0024C2C10B|nr:histidine kinase [Streptomyces sp. 549]MDK1472429.1 histidine kinase [Streptomyces sp. 549]
MRTVRTTWRWTIGPEPWSALRVVGETVALLVATGAAFAVQMSEHGWRLALLSALSVLLLAALRRPLPAVTLLLTAGLGGVLVGMWLLLPITAWSAGRRIERPTKALAVFGAAFGVHLLTELVGLVREGIAISSWVVLLLSSLWLLASMVVPGLTARYLAQRRALLASVQAQHHQLLRENAIIAREAQLRERQRIAQDMHDSLGHQLTLIAVHTGALQVDPELSDTQRVAVGVLRDASVNAMRELREVVGVLREDATESRPQEGAETPAAGSGLDAVAGLVESSRAAGASVELHHRGTARPLPAVADRAAYRIVQEGLTNAHKHAYGAPITVSLDFEPDSLLVEVVNGPRPAVPSSRLAPAISGGRGLAGLGERARLAGGMLHRGPLPDGGFRLAGVLPYEPSGVAVRPPEDATEAQNRGAGKAAGRAFGTAAADAAGSVPASATVSAAGSESASGAAAALPAALTALSGGHGADAEDPRMRMHRDYDRLLSRRRRACLPWGCGIAALTMVLLVVLLVWGATTLMDEFRNSLLEPEEYASVKVGQPERVVRDRLPNGESLLTSGLSKGEPEIPTGATCLRLLSTEDTPDWNTDLVFRFCFKDDVLVSKDRYTTTP